MAKVDLARQIEMGGEVARLRLVEVVARDGQGDLN